VPSSSSSTAQQARQHLADQLREIRLGAGLTGKALAKAAGWHGVSKVSKIEHGMRPASAEDVRTWCRVCGVSAERSEELLAEQRAAAGMWVTYQRLHRAGLRQAQASVRPSYEQSSLVRSYQPRIVPGLLQTAGYTGAILSAVRDRHAVPVDDVEAAVAERMDRQNVLRRAGHRFLFVVEEAVLRYRICDAETMIGQLTHLGEAMRIPSVSLAVIPLAADRVNTLAVEAFTMFDDKQVRVELVSGLLTITQPREVAMYAERFAALSAAAVTGARARALILAAVDALSE